MRCRHTLRALRRRVRRPGALAARGGRLVSSLASRAGESAHGAVREVAAAVGRACARPVGARDGGRGARVCVGVGGWVVWVCGKAG